MIKQSFIKLGMKMLKFYAFVSILFFSVLILALLNKGVFMFSYVAAANVFTNVTKTAKMCRETKEKDGLEKMGNK